MYNKLNRDELLKALDRCVIANNRLLKVGYIEKPHELFGDTFIFNNEIENDLERVRALLKVMDAYYLENYDKNVKMEVGSINNKYILFDRNKISVERAKEKLENFIYD